MPENKEETERLMKELETLRLRMDAHSDNAQALAEWLQDQPEVEQVFYAGLPGHPGHDIASSQMKGFGGMLSFEIDGDLAVAKKFVESVSIFALAESLGGVESLIELPALMTHASVPAEERKKIGLSDTLIRLSVGIENGDDLLEDLESAFGKI